MSVSRSLARKPQTQSHKVDELINFVDFMSNDSVGFRWRWFFRGRVFFRCSSLSVFAISAFLLKCRRIYVRRHSLRMRITNPAKPFQYILLFWHVRSTIQMCKKGHRKKFGRARWMQKPNINRNDLLDFEW